MNRSLLAVLAALGLLLTAAACGSGSPEAKPPEIAYGQDVCDHCGMLISDERFAAGYVTAGGETRRFDDIGDLLAYDAERGEDVAAYWVHDYDTAGWLRAEDAWFLSTPGVTTPMASGLVAFAERSRADGLAASDGGVVMQWDELSARFAAGEVGAGMMGGMDDVDMDAMEPGEEGDTSSMP